MLPWIIGGAVILLIIIVVGYFISTKNKFVVLEENVGNAWSQIDVSLKKRYDLIPNLVSTVKGYAKHESQTLENIAKLRTQAMQAGNPEEAIEANNKLSSEIRNLLVSVESYPDLKANTNFLDLQRQLRSVEETLEMTRRFYNDTITKFNRLVKMFPSSIVASMSNYTSKIYYQVDERDRENVTVSFD